MCVLRYLKGTIHYGMKYEGDGELLLHGFVDSDWDGYASSRKSTSSYCETFFTFFFYLGLDSASIFVCFSILWYLCPFHILGSTSGIVANFSILKSKQCSRITEGISSHLSI